MAPRRNADCLQMKVTLDGIDPPVWRRVVVPDAMTLGRLHSVLQVAMGWTNSHLHCFVYGDRRFGMVGVEEDAPDLEDERRTHISTLLRRKGDELVYQYDYGDGWEHLVALESVVHRDVRLHYPLCVGGARACPPEDCGGAGGYEDLVRVLGTPGDPEHDNMVTWVGGYFDPESFDPNAVNRVLQRGR